VDVSTEERDSNMLLFGDPLALLNEPVSLVLVISGGPVIGETA